MPHIWMRHRETGGVAQLPDVEAWRALGWEPTEAPADTDPAMAERVPATETTTAAKPGRRKLQNPEGTD